MSARGKERRGLEQTGCPATTRLHWNLEAPQLYEAAIARGEATLAAGGLFVLRTGQRTDRGPQDTFIVHEPGLHPEVDWGAVNRPLDNTTFDVLHGDFMAYLADRTLFALDAVAGADPEYRMPIRLVTELAWHNLFASTTFITETSPEPRRQHRPPWTVIDAPSFKADPRRHGTGSDVFVVIHVSQRLVLIGGTSDAGEIRKAIVTVLNYTLPSQGVLSMHCSATIGATGDVALFLGLSGTGKATLSNDPARRRIGDDEHGWSHRGVFSLEGGCYAKAVNASTDEPLLSASTRRVGTVLENVITLADTREWTDLSASPPPSCIEHAELLGLAGHPTNFVMLTADAAGVLPPIARLTPEGAMYHFLSGYSAKIAGTANGVGEPRATFSACFGVRFLPLKPIAYARLLGEQIARHQVHVWLVNTGWTGGPYGVGSRIRPAHARALIAAALGGQLDAVTYRRDAIFNLDVPTVCPGVPERVLDPRSLWTDSTAYDDQATRLARMFILNFTTFERDVTKAVTAAGPTTRGGTTV